jgi:hypothetical protein
LLLSRQTREKKKVVTGLVSCTVMKCTKEELAGLKGFQSMRKVDCVEELAGWEVIPVSAQG